MTDDLLVVDDLQAGYEDVLVLRGVTLRAAADEIVSILGPNGAGKSTLLKAVAGLVRPRAGSVVFAGADVTGARPHRLARSGMGFVPQLDNVFPSLTITENVRVGAQALPRAERGGAIGAILDLFPLLRDRPGQRAGTLSGGQRKLVALARALVARPSLLLLDEPSAGLSPQAVEMVFDQLASIRARGTGIVMVEQNARRALAVSDRGYVLDQGRNAYEGNGAALLSDPKVSDLYLGAMAMPGARTHTPEAPSDEEEQG